MELKQDGLDVIKVFSIDAQFDFLKTVPYKNMVDFFLFDTKSDGYGGTGKSFDWSLLNQYDQEIPFFLSGGLSILNIEQTKNIRKMNLHAFDFNSGVELSPGLKSVERIIELNAVLSSTF